ncbi:HNH-family nuclease [Azospirillum sp. B510]|nr:HNH-family nuclease [Azospirillum sp. B510]
MPTRPPMFRSPGWKTPQQKRKAHDQARGSASSRGYDSDWRKLRARFLKAHPLCCVTGCGERATDVDHIQGVRERPDLRLEWSNLRSMCHPHHSKRTARDQAFGRVRG